MRNPNINPTAETDPNRQLGGRLKEAIGRVVVGSVLLTSAVAVAEAVAAGEAIHGAEATALEAAARSPEARKLAAMNLGENPLWNGGVVFERAKVHSRPDSGEASVVRVVHPGEELLSEHFRLTQLRSKDGKKELWAVVSPAHKGADRNQATDPKWNLWINISSKNTKYTPFVYKNDNPDHPRGQVVDRTIRASVDKNGNLSATGKDGIIPHRRLATAVFLPKKSAVAALKQRGLVRSKFRVRYISPRQGEQPKPPGVSPEQGTTPNPVTPETQTPIDLDAITREYLRTDTVYLPFMNGCSGFLIRDADGNPIGASTVQHCGLRTETTPRIQGSDGKLYAVMSQPLDVKNGEDLNNLRTVGIAESVIVPNTGDPSHDLALIVFKGSTKEQVIASYTATLANATELQPGQKIYTSGFPLAQPNNLTGDTRRETMETTYLGPAIILTTNWQNIPAKMVGINKNADGSICSYGDSGAEGILPLVAQNPDGTYKYVARKLGTLAAYDDFRPASESTIVLAGYDGPAVRKERAGQTGYNLEPYEGACYFTSEMFPNTDTLILVNSTSQIPGYNSSLGGMRLGAPSPPSELIAPSAPNVIRVSR